MTPTIRAWIQAGCLACSTLLLPATVLGHAFGKIGVDHYIVVTPTPEGVEIDLDTHFAELPTAAIRARHDTNRDGVLDRSETLNYIRQAKNVYLNRFETQVYFEGRRLVLPPEFPDDDIEANTQSYIAKGVDGEDTLRIRWLMRTPWPDPIKNGPIHPIGVEVRSLIRIDYLSSKIVTGPVMEPLSMLASDVPTKKEVPRPPDITPIIEDVDQVPAVTRARFICVLGPYSGPVPDLDAFIEGKIEQTGTEADPRDASVLAVQRMPRAGSGESRIEIWQEQMRQTLHDLFKPPISRVSWTLAILLCFAWGAIHAFIPGHGKTVVTATLIGARARYSHAIVMGVLVTLTHTAIVLILAGAAYRLQDRFEYPPWLQPLGAIIILLVGVNQIRIGLIRLVADDAPKPDPNEPEAETHTHWGFRRHSHAPKRRPASASAPSSMRDVMAIGATGGLVPCPAAIVTVLIILSVGTPFLTLICMISFSLGLAVALMAIGFLAISGSRLVEWMFAAQGRKHRVRLDVIMPVLGGIVLLLSGWILLQL